MATEQAGCADPAPGPSGPTPVAGVARAPAPVRQRAVSNTALLVRLPNWVGDAVLALPVLDELERAGFSLVAAGRAWCQDLLAAYDLRLVAVTRNHLAAAVALRRLGVSRGVLLTRSFGSALEMRLAGVRVIGYRAHGRSALLSRSLPTPAVGHLIQQYWWLGRQASAAFGGAAEAFSGPPAPPTLRLGGTHRRAAGRALERAGVTPPFQVWCPLATSAIRGHSKEWPHFAELCRRLSGDGVQIVCCPGPGELERARAALPGAHILPGLGLGAMAAVMARARLVLANDTGPMHIAAGVGTRVLGLFGPGNDPSSTGPVGGRTLGGRDGWPDAAAVGRELDRLAAG